MATRECRPLLPGRGLNTLFENYSWLDPDTIAVCVIPAGRDARPVRYVPMDSACHVIKRILNHRFLS